MKKIVKGNDFIMRIPVMKIVNSEKQAFPLPACTDIMVRLCSAFRRYELTYTIDAKDDNVLLARVEGDKIPCGSYALEVRGKVFGNDWRSNEYEQLVIVDNNEKADTEFGKTDEGENSVEMDTAIVYLPPSTELSGLITEAQETVKTVTALNEQVTVSEEERAKSEESRVQAELTRASNEAERVQAEQVRESAENARTEAEAARQEAEKTRTRTEEEREANELTRKTNEQARQANEEARQAAEQEREKRCAAAATGAENCNITMQGSTITVTDRDGRQNSVDVVDTDEVVTLTVATAVDSIDVSGIKIKVYFNHDTKSPLQLTTNAEGMATFIAKRGEYYEVKLPEYGYAQPIAPIGFTATLPGREISVTYMPYDKDSSEEVAVTVVRYPDGKYTAWANKEVKCTYDGNTSSFLTDSKGKVTIYVPLNKTYTITVDDEDGYMVYMKKNRMTYTAELSYREVSFALYQYSTGLFCLTSDGMAYSIDEFMATGKDSSEVVAFKWVDYNLITHKGTFAFRTSDLRNAAGLTTTKWSSESINFPSIPSSGYNPNVAYFYNGQDATTLIRQDAITLNVTADAADVAYGQALVIGGETLHGFLPGGGQVNAFIDNMTLLRDIMTRLYGKDVSDDFYVNFKPCWSCIQHATSNGLFFTNKTTNFRGKGDKSSVLPAFSV